MNQIPRNIVHDQEAREKLKSGIVEFAKTVKSTLGAAGQTVLIESPNKLRGITVTKDGVTVAKEIFFEDPVENLAAQIIRDAADKTATAASDGTTTAVVIAEALVLSGMELIKPEHDKTEILREINRLAIDVARSLKGYSRKLTKGLMRDVATISANNDPVIGKLVADAYLKAGKNALVSVDNSDTSETYIETTSGIKFKRGYDVRAYVNSQTKDQCILKDVYVLITDHQIENYGQVQHIVDPIISKGLSLLIVGNMSNNMKQTFGINVVKSAVKLCSITPPQFGYKQVDMMEDLAVSLGGKFFSEKNGDDLSLFGLEDLGRASKIVVDQFSTVITKDVSLNTNVKTRISELKGQIKTTKKQSDIDHLNERIAILDGGMGVIFAGGNSDVEQKELFDRIEDAVGAVQSALEEGVIPGGGVPLLRIANLLPSVSNSTSTFIAIKILENGLTAPFYQILDNAGKSSIWVSDALIKIVTEGNKNYGFDVKANKYVDLVEAGILDPLKVTTNAVKNAVSVATTILSTNAVITLAREK